jgi:hypothetical protein
MAANQGVEALNGQGNCGSIEGLGQRDSWNGLKRRWHALKARVEELRRSFIDMTSANGIEEGRRQPAQFCREVKDTFTRLVGASRRTVATWLVGNPPNRRATVGTD